MPSHDTEFRFRINHKDYSWTCHYPDILATVRKEYQQLKDNTKMTKEEKTAVIKEVIEGAKKEVRRRKDLSKLEKSKAQSSESRVAVDPSKATKKRKATFPTKAELERARFNKIVKDCDQIFIDKGFDSWDDAYGQIRLDDNPEGLSKYTAWSDVVALHHRALAALDAAWKAGIVLKHADGPLLFPVTQTAREEVCVDSEAVADHVRRVLKNVLTTDYSQPQLSMDMMKKLKNDSTLFNPTSLDALYERLTGRCQEELLCAPGLVNDSRVRSLIQALTDFMDSSCSLDRVERLGKVWALYAHGN